MRTTALVTMTCLLVLAWSGARAAEDDKAVTYTPGQPTGLKGPYLGQPAPGIKPELFARGIVSLEGSRESACTLSPDGKEFYYTRSNSQIMVSRWEAGGWTYPAPVAFLAGVKAFEPHVTHDNKHLYFNGDIPPPAGETQGPGPRIYVAERIAGGWSTPKHVGAGMFVSSSRDGTLYTTHLNAFPNCDYVSRVVMEGVRFVGYDDLKGGIEKLRGTYDAIAHPCIAPDGSYLVFDVGGGPHLFVSFKSADGTWGDAIDLSQHGLDAQAGIASLSPDGKYLFFGQNGDLYWVSTQLIEALRPPRQAG